MKTSLTVLTELELVDNDLPVIYFSKPYLANQNHARLVCYESTHCFLPVSLHEDLAISIPRSPFGSLLVKDNWSRDEFLQCFDEIKKDLQSKGVATLQIKHPAAIYSNFVNENWLPDAGFEQVYSDINQQIPLNDQWAESIHMMQKRKLDALQAEEFEFRKMDIKDLKIAHQFIAVCRQTQGLVINIDIDLLQKLVDSTNAYDIFGVFRDDKFSSVCIAVRVTDKIAYYYLPATSPMFRTQSPMVLLIKGMVEYYQSIGYEYLDMGISSVEGKPQESLRIFKERMGAVESSKTTWRLRI